MMLEDHGKHTNDTNTDLLEIQAGPGSYCYLMTCAENFERNFDLVSIITATAN